MNKDNAETFPRNLLQETVKKRCEYFWSRIIKHPSLMNAFEKAQNAILDSSPGSIIFLFGPTGVGKTTLLEKLCERLAELFFEDLKKDKGRFPVVLLLLDSPLPDKFEWKDYFRSLLIELKEPEVDRKIAIAQWPTKELEGNVFTSILKTESNKHTSRSVMRVAAMQALKNRKPLAVLVDSAQHFGQIGSGRKYLDQLNIIKSMAEKSRVTHVMAGTYELLPFRNLNGQLSRRSIDVHFGRYHADDATQLNEFKNVLFTFQQHLPLHETPDLASQWEYFYEGSIGCVGILKDWLYQSLGLALRERSHTLLPEHLEQCARSIAQRTSMLREITTGENDLKEEEAGRAQLRISMGLEAEAKELILKAAEDNQVKASQDRTPNVPKKRHKRSVGRRSPKRDRIGKKVA